MKHQATGRRCWGRFPGYSAMTFGPIIETYVEEHRLKQKGTARPWWGRAPDRYEPDSGCYGRPVGRPSGYSALMTLTAVIETYAEKHRQTGSLSPYKGTYSELYEMLCEPVIIEGKKCWRDRATKKVCDFERFRWNYNRKRQRGRKLWRDSLKAYSQLGKDLPPWLERLKNQL